MAKKGGSKKTKRKTTSLSQLFSVILYLGLVNYINTIGNIKHRLYGLKPSTYIVFVSYIYEAISKLLVLGGGAYIYIYVLL